MLILGPSSPSLLLGQSKLAASLRTSRGVGQTSKASSTSKMGQLIGSEVFRFAARVGTALGGAYFGTQYLMGNLPGQTESPLEVMGRASARGFYGTMTDEYATGQVRNAQTVADADAEARWIASQRYSNRYRQENVADIWAEQQARYYANLNYPTFPVQTTKTSQEKVGFPSNWNIQ